MQRLEFPEIQIEVIHKNIRRIHLHITQERVWMSIPLRVTLAEAEWFARKHLTWITEQSELVNMRRTATADIKTGTILRLWGNPLHVQIEPTCGHPTVIHEGDTLRLFISTQDGQAACQSAIDSWFRTQLTLSLGDVCKRWETVVGRRAESYYIRRMNTRWGSCSLKTRRICVNAQLVHEPPEWLNYVIVHELTHFLVPNHSTGFWALMDGFYPNWRTVRHNMRE